MADFTIVPLPISADPGQGFWNDLKEALITASAILEANTNGADSSSDSSSGADVAYDPDVATVTEFLTGVQTIIDSYRETE